MRAQPDETVLRREAARLGRGVQLPPLEVLQRVEIRTRMGTTEQVLAQTELRVLSRKPWPVLSLTQRIPVSAEVQVIPATARMAP